jgi:hypothetical protein
MLAVIAAIVILRFAVPRAFEALGGGIRSALKKRG